MPNIDIGLVSNRARYWGEEPPRAGLTCLLHRTQSCR